MSALRLFSPLRFSVYRRLFAAQVIALLGTGFATVALALLAYDLAGGEAGLVLGTALAIKMVAYVGLSPFAGVLSGRLPRRGLLVGLDVVRMGAALFLPFVTQVWQIYALIFVLQAGSALFTPTFQATIPDVLEDERDYTNALSLSRFAYDLESLLSPAVAAALLTLISFHGLFAGTAVGFAVSAALVLSVTLPWPAPSEEKDFLGRLTGGLRTFFATPRLRGVAAINMAVAAAGAMVIVNTVVYVRDRLGLGEAETALALAAFGAGSMLAALILPRLLDHVADRAAMLTGSVLLGAGMAASLTRLEFTGLLAVWFALGFGYSLAQTPIGRLLRRSAHADARPALYAAQFAASHACWLATYPLVGWLGARFGLDTAFWVSAGLVLVATLTALRVWPATDKPVIEHVHRDLPPDHPHLRDARPAHSGFRHAHDYVIDRLHPRWPTAT